jgi:Recombinase zinc beta ribbon domain
MAAGMPTRRDPEPFPRGLLRCEHCGRPLHVQRYGEKVYYRCRGEDAPDRCQAPMIREDQLIPWADDLFHRLDAHRPDGFAEAVAGQGKAPHNPGAVAQVELTLERLGKRFMWGHVDEADYLQERSRLEAVRTDLQVAAQPRQTIKLEGLVDAWDTGDPQTRRELLTVLFDALHVNAEGISGYTPRHDREAEVVGLMNAAWQLRRERDSNPRRLAP